MQILFEYLLQKYFGIPKKPLFIMLWIKFLINNKEMLSKFVIQAQLSLRVTTQPDQFQSLPAPQSAAFEGNQTSESAT